MSFVQKYHSGKFVRGTCVFNIIWDTSLDIVLALQLGMENGLEEGGGFLSFLSAVFRFKSTFSRD